MAPILGIYASQISGHLFAPSGAYDSIATASGTGSSGVITFTSIPSTYTHLQIRWIAKSTAAGSYSWLNFNNDTASNYANHYLYGDGASALAGADTGQARINLYGSVSTSTASNVYTAHVVDILDYANSNKNTTVRALGGQDNNGSGTMFLSSGLWNITTAISAITITANTANFTTDSKFALYGIKGN